MNKHDLRKIMRQRKAIVHRDDLLAQAQRVFGIIEHCCHFASSQNILLYHSLPDELPTHDTIARWSKTKNIFLPRVNGETLEVVALGSALSSDNKYHIAEPQGAAVDPGRLDLIIVPAVALDPHGHRLGRGKGFYDRLLATTQAYTMGVAMDCQLVDIVPCEQHDITLNAVITSTHQYYDIDKCRNKTL